MDEVAIVLLAISLAEGATSGGTLAAGALFAYIAPGAVVAYVFPGLGGSPDRVLFADALLRGGLFSALGVLAILGRLPSAWFIVALAIASLFSSSSRGARWSFLRYVVGDDRFGGASALVSTVTQVSVMLGPGVAGVLAGVSSPGIVLIIDGITFMLLVPIILVVKRLAGMKSDLSKDDAAEPLDATSPPRLEDQEAQGIRKGMYVVGLTGAFFFLYAPMVPALPEYLLENVGLGETEASIMLGAAWSTMGFGALIGALVFGNRAALATLPLLAGIAGLWGAATIGVGLSDSVVVILVLMFSGGLAFGPYTPLSMQLLQRSLSGRQYGKMNSRYAAVANGAQPIGLLVGGLTLAALGPRLTLVLSGFALILLPVVLAPAWRRIAGWANTT